MVNFIGEIVVIRSKFDTYFFDPETLLIFSKTGEDISDEEVVGQYKKSKKNFPPERACKNQKDFSEFNEVSLEFHITNNCNLRCKYCYVGTICEKERNLSMSEKTIEKAFSFVERTFPKIKSVQISLYGGEPLLVWKIFPFLVKKAKEILKDKKVFIGFPTNGTIANEEILKFLKENNIGFQLSWDGPAKFQDLLRPTEEGNSSSLLLEHNFKLFKAFGKRLTVRSTITSMNRNLSEIFLFFKEKGFERISLCLCSSEINHLFITKKQMPSILEELEKLAALYLRVLVEEGNLIELNPFFGFFNLLHKGIKKHRSCGSARNLFAVSPDESIYACHRFVGNEKFKIGDLEQGFYQNDLQRAFFNYEVDQEKSCKNCFARYLCGGGCKHNNSLPTKSIYCLFTRASLIHAIEIYGELKTRHSDVYNKITKKLETDSSCKVT